MILNYTRKVARYTGLNRIMEISVEHLVCIMSRIRDPITAEAYYQKNKYKIPRLCIMECVISFVIVGKLRVEM